jgi:hypothetical protein
MQLSQFPEFSTPMSIPMPGPAIMPSAPFGMHASQQQPQQQQQPQFPAAPPQTHQSAGNGMAVAGFVMGLLSIFLFWIPCLGSIFPLLGLIFSGVGISNAKKPDRNGKGRGLAIAGLVLSLITLIISVLIAAGMILANL